MIKKILGYLSTIIGIAGLTLTFPKVMAIAKITLPIDNLTLTIVSLVFVGFGILILLKDKGSKRKVREVPIYKGKDIVGYRRD